MLYPCRKYVSTLKTANFVDVSCRKCGVENVARPLYRGLIRPCMEYTSHVWRGSTLIALLTRVESKAFRLSNSSPLTDCLSFFLIAAMLALLRSFTSIFIVTALLIVVTACLPCSCGLAAQDLPLPLTPILSIHLMQELNGIFNLSSLPLVNSGTLSLLLYFHLPMT